MIKLWYDSDEVAVFHPIVMDCLNQILLENGLDNDYSVDHHPIVPGSTRTPDFSIYKKMTRRIVYILEVKRTTRDVDSQRYWNQTHGYVRDLTYNWEPGNKYFSITNIEKTITFADKDGPTIGCVLSNNPQDAGRFDKAAITTVEVIENFKKIIEPVILAAVKNTDPIWADAWNPIIRSFSDNLRSTINELSTHKGNELGKEIGTYELLRVFLYHFISSYYDYSNSSNVKYFRRSRLNSNATLAFRELKNSYDRALELDFKQIFSDAPIYENRITEEQFQEVVRYFNSFVEILQNYIMDAVRQNHSPAYFFNLLTQNLYAHEELHREGKVMSDSELAALIAELCIESPSLKIFDPGCGDGSLLDAAYDKLYDLKSATNSQFTHQEILNQINGIEIDPFLTQLAAFRLLMKNASEVDENTEASIETNNVFKKQSFSEYDVILMNPPFLRNEEISASFGSSINEMVEAIKSVEEDPFVISANKPNLYFYFINYVNHYLKNNGMMGLILMSKFMNNQEASHLKTFMMDKVEAIITYPKSYFQQFKVTTSIVILRKNTSNARVKFLNVRTENLLDNPKQIRLLLAQESSTINPEYSLRVVARKDLDPGSNWRTYLLDPEDKFMNFKAFPGFVKLPFLFNTIKRGNAGVSGGSDLIFPSHASNVPRNVLCNGMRWNKLSKGNRRYILTDEDFTDQQAIDFPLSYNENYEFGYDPSINDPFFERLYEKSANTYPKWRQILNDAVSSRLKAQIIIPRADRTKHSVFYNATGSSIMLSTNFFALADFTGHANYCDEETQIKFVCAFLLSSFGQLQFELLANDQEGMRKIEQFMIKDLFVPDPLKASVQNIESTVDEFECLNKENAVFVGLEGFDAPRTKLDLAVAETLLDMGLPGFDNKVTLTKYVQRFLVDTVEERVN